jgi:hypothetical protein
VNHRSKVSKETFDYKGIPVYWIEWIAPGESLFEPNGLSRVPFWCWEFPARPTFKLELKWYRRLWLWFLGRRNVEQFHKDEFPSYETVVHTALTENLKRIAYKRYRNGLPPKFWLEDSRFW